MASEKHIVVIGAGVIGLTTAVFLAEAGYRVTVIAAHVPGDSSIEYTSPWAGAHWLPHARAHEPMLCDWDIQTYNYWIDLLRKEDADPTLPKCGIKNVPSYELFDTQPGYDIWYAPHVQSFRQISPSTDPVVSSTNARSSPSAPQVTQACTYTAQALNVPQYLLYLSARAEKAGARVVKHRLRTDGGFEGALGEAERIATGGQGRVDCFIHATGLGAKKLCGDGKMFPIRGQTVLVKGEAGSTITRVGEGYRAYCISRPGSGTTILGGTMEVGVWDEKPEEDVTKEILERNSWQVPELLTGRDGGFEVISVQCGLRPGREGGPRVERERVGKREVVHAYGHAGAGYQNSVGCARMVMGLVREAVGVKEVKARL